MITETWKDIKGYEGLYQVSNLGNVKSLARKNSNVCLNDKILKPVLDREKGYKRVCLCKDNKCRRMSVHRLVAETFIPNFENKPQVNHIDGNKQNNIVNNLEWCTCKENIQHSIRMGLVDVEKRKNNMKKIGKISYKNNCKKVKQYNLDGVFMKEWCSLKEASVEMKIIISSISNCISGKSKSAGGYIWKY